MAKRLFFCLLCILLWLPKTQASQSPDDNLYKRSFNQAFSFSSGDLAKKSFSLILVEDSDFQREDSLGIQTPCSLMSLPPYLICRIVLTSSTVYSTRSICKRIQSIVDGPEVWRHQGKFSFTLNSLPPQKTPIGFASLTDIPSQLSQDEQVGMPISSLGHLQNLSGLRLTIPHKPGALKELASLSHLQFLSIQFSSHPKPTMEQYEAIMVDLGRGLEQLPNLRYLVLHIAADAVQCLSHMTAVIQNLEYLYLKKASSITKKKGVDALPLEELLHNSLKLRSLGLHDWTLDATTALAITQCTTLKHLGISRIGNLKQTLQQIANKNPALSSLTLKLHDFMLDCHKHQRLPCKHCLDMGQVHGKNRQLYRFTSFKPQQHFSINIARATPRLEGECRQLTEDNKTVLQALSESRSHLKVYYNSFAHPLPKSFQVFEEPAFNWQKVDSEGQTLQDCLNRPYSGVSQ